MCGICGIHNRNGDGIDDTELSAMNNAMTHRGPDGEGVFLDRSVGLGHRRLSIIDLAGGTQPMSNETGRLQLVFNGEIYNYIELREELQSCGHTFTTKSDTEVIIHGYEQWGTACLNRFNGIFAFALWDPDAERLFAARDHLGIKPLYYTLKGPRLYFASEIKSLLKANEVGAQVGLAELGDLFTFGYVPSPGTIFKGISKIPPGHLLLADRHGVKIERYWFRHPESFLEMSNDELVARYRALVQEAVRLQMRSDVPVGLFLSSGVDSSALLSLMRNHTSSPVYTFTIGFEGGVGTNETDDAARIARHFGAQHDQLMVKPVDYLEYYARYLNDIEEPLANESAAAFHFVSRLAAQRVKVVLTGQGVDEPWAGYHRYIGLKLSQWYSRLPATVTQTLVPSVARMLWGNNERITRGTESLAEADMLSRFVKIYSFFPTSLRERLFLPWVKKELATEAHDPRELISWLDNDVKHLDPLTRMLFIDTRLSLCDDLLMVADKTGMANSIEVRVPFLDLNVVHFIERLRPELKLHGFTGKYLHKKAMEKWVPKRVVWAKKKGFENPVTEWLKREMRGYVTDMLLGPTSMLPCYFEKKVLRELIDEHASGKRHNMRHLYLLMSFAMWHSTFIKK